jgi:hypothetical protein
MPQVDNYQPQKTALQIVEESFLSDRGSPLNNQCLLAFEKAGIGYSGSVMQGGVV